MSAIWRERIAKGQNLTLWSFSKGKKWARFLEVQRLFLKRGIVCFNIPIPPPTPQSVPLNYRDTLAPAWGTRSHVVYSWERRNARFLKSVAIFKRQWRKVSLANQTCLVLETNNPNLGKNTLLVSRPITSHEYFAKCSVALFSPGTSITLFFHKLISSET